MQKSITVSGIESKSTRTGGLNLTIVSPEGKYHFFDKKKDQTPTKAYEGWEKLNPRIGDTLLAEVSEEEKTFTNEQGKEITFMDRRIMYFITDGEKMEAAQPKTPITEDRIGKMIEWAKGIEDRVKHLEER